MFLPPMLLETRDSPFDDDRYLFEPKIDGHRMIVSMENGKVSLYTRYRYDVTDRYPELHRVPINDNSDAVLDGVVACIHPETGLIDYEGALERFKLLKPMAIMQGAVRHPVIFFAFDLLRYKGEDLRDRPLLERKKILSRALSENKHYSLMIHADGAGKSMFEAMREKKIGGIVAKRKDSPYVGRRDSSWLKIQLYGYADVQIVGYRKSQFGWLMEHRKRPVGILESAVPRSHRNAFYGVSKHIATGEDRDFVYVLPGVKARIRFRSWTSAGTFRAPEFVEFVV